MKYHNGCWILKEGYQCFSPKQAYEIRKTDTQLWIVAPTARIEKKGDTLGGVNLSVCITSPKEDVIRVQTFHHRGAAERGPSFELEGAEPAKLDCEIGDELITVKSGGLTLEININDWAMTYRRGGEVLTFSGAKDLGYVRQNWTGEFYARREGAFMQEQLNLSVGELIYGFGEQFTPFVKNGQSVYMWNEDGGTSTEQSYKNIPFYLSSRGYGVFVNHPERVEFEVGSEQVKKVAFMVPGEKLDYFFFNGPTMKEALERYTDLTGKPSLPPQWSFGLWLSTSFTTSYDEETVMSFIDGMEERGIPLSVFHFDCCWMREFHWTDFIWDERIFPDPAGLISRIKAKGIKVCVWINSYIAQESALFDEGMEKGYFLKHENGDVWQWDMWQPGLAIVDFTNPEATAWYQGLLEKLMDMGVDCFKTDFGERIPTDCVYYNNADPVKMHNYYTYLYNKAVYEVIARRKDKEEAIVFARSATAGGQKFPVHWGGDCWSDYGSMTESLRGGLSLTSSGFGFWSHDIGGFENTSTPDVYKRWCAFGLLSTHSRLHGSTSYRVPWVYDDEAVDVVRFFTRLKIQLLPYLYSCAVQTSITGVPMMRSMALEFNGAIDCSYLDKQYMLGDSLLVAPIFNDEGKAEYYLPRGSWTNFFTGEVCNGGWRTEKHGYLSIPLWVRENSIVPIQTDPKRTALPYVDELEFRCYKLNGESSVDVYQDGEKQAALAAKADKGSLTLKAEGKSCKVRLVACKAEGDKATSDGNDTLICLEAGEELSLTL